MKRCRDLAADRRPSAQPPSLLQAEDVIHWFFRDSRSSPLELEHDASGSEASDDEAATKDHPQDLSHLNDDNCTRCAGFLLKRSAHDPNLWRKRFCILAGDKLWYMKRRPQRCRGQLVPATCLALVSARVKEAASNVPFGFELQTVDRSHAFRAFGRHAKRDQLQKVQRGWMQALVGQIRYTDENDMMCMAEHIISDFEGARVRRAQRRMCSALAACSWSRARSRGAVQARRSAFPEKAELPSASTRKTPCGKFRSSAASAASSARPRALPPMWRL